LIEQSEPTSYLVAHPLGGLSDSLTGLVTSFLLAYVSGRKFYLSNSSILHRCADFNFNVTVPDSLIFRNDKAILLHKKHSDVLLRKVVKSKESTIHVKGNRGAVYKIVTSAEFQNFDSLHLLEVGEDFIFGCLVRFLVIPTKATMEYFRAEIEELTRNSRNITIGVQIRTRAAMRNPGSSIEQIIAEQFYNLFRDCSINLSRNRGAVIFILSDSIDLRHKLIKDLNKHGILAFTTGVENVREIKVDGSSEYNKSKISQGEEVFGESFLFSLCDLFIYTKRSGFGRVAAARGMLKDAYYPVSERKRIGSISSPAQCSGRGVTMKHIESDSAGL